MTQGNESAQSIPKQPSTKNTMQPSAPFAPPWSIIPDWPPPRRGSQEEKGEQGWLRAREHAQAGRSFPPPPPTIQVAWWLPLLVLVFRRPHREYALEFPTFLWDHKNPLTSVSGMSHLNSLTCIKESTESLVVFLIIVNLFWLHPIWNCVSIETVSLTNQISPSGPASSHNVSIFFHPLMSWSEQDKFDYQTTSGAFGTHLIISIYSVMSIDTL